MLHFKLLHSLPAECKYLVRLQHEFSYVVAFRLTSHGLAYDSGKKLSNLCKLIRLDVARAAPDAEKNNCVGIDTPVILSSIMATTLEGLENLLHYTVHTFYHFQEM